jgi:hypothetical protein
MVSQEETVALFGLKVDPYNRLLENVGQNCVNNSRRGIVVLQLRKKRQRNDLVVIRQRVCEYSSDERKDLLMVVKER